MTDQDDSRIGRILDVLPFAVVTLDRSRNRILVRNKTAATWFPEDLPDEMLSAVESQIRARTVAIESFPAQRVSLQGVGYFVQARPEPGPPPVEVLLIHREVVRDGHLLQLLEKRYHVSRREYQILLGLRLGKTNREIAAELGIAEGTAARYVHGLLDKMGARNRTRLVDLVEQVIARGY